ncbi:MAG: transposase [Selenomonadaceae bacterium]|nr:transposase [Selenomonadaceae bacterium]
MAKKSLQIWDELPLLANHLPHDGRHTCATLIWEKLELLNAVLYLVKTPCQWRNLPHDFPPMFTVHSFYRRARFSGLWDSILTNLVRLTRRSAGLSEEPTQTLMVVIAAPLSTKYANISV